MCEQITISDTDITRIADAVVSRLMTAKQESSSISNEIAMCKMRGVDLAEYLKDRAKAGTIARRESKKKQGRKS